MWSFVSAFLHSAWCFQGSSTLWHVLALHSLLWLSNIPVYRCTLRLSNHQLMGFWPLHVAPIKDRAAMDIYLYKSVSVYVFSFLGVIRRSGIAELCGNCQAFLGVHSGSGRVWLLPHPLGQSELQTPHRVKGRSWCKRLTVQRASSGPSCEALSGTWHIIGTQYYSQSLFSWLLKIIQNWGCRENTNC